MDWAKPDFLTKATLKTTDEPKIYQRVIVWKRYELSNHLGNVLATVSDRKIPVEYDGNKIIFGGTKTLLTEATYLLGESGTFFEPDIATANDYYPFGMGMPGRMFKAEGAAYRYGFGGHEESPEIGGGMVTTEYREMDTRIGRWLSLDPHLLRYPGWSPYNYVYNSPLACIDPDGRDPIFGRNFFGKVKLIGDDGKNDGKSYLVRGSVKRDVKRATKEGAFYKGSLIESKKVFKIPTGGVMDDVMKSVSDTEASEKENGGHANFGALNATRWDEGAPAHEVKDEKGNVIAIKATLKAFRINGQSQIPNDASNVEFWWHTHPKTSVGGVELGSSNPSPADLSFQQKMEGNKFKGNTFVIGVRSATVTFFNSGGALITISYSDFKKMGGKN